MEAPKVPQQKATDANMATNPSGSDGSHDERVGSKNPDKEGVKEDEVQEEIKEDKVKEDETKDTVEDDKAKDDVGGGKVDAPGPDEEVTKDQVKIDATDPKLDDNADVEKGVTPAPTRNPAAVSKEPGKSKEPKPKPKPKPTSKGKKDVTTSKEASSGTYNQYGSGSDYWVREFGKGCEAALKNVAKAPTGIHLFMYLAYHNFNVGKLNEYEPWKKFCEACPVLAANIVQTASKFRSSFGEKANLPTPEGATASRNFVYLYAPSFDEGVVPLSKRQNVPKGTKPKTALLTLEENAPKTTPNAAERSAKDIKIEDGDIKASLVKEQDKTKQPKTAKKPKKAAAPEPVQKQDAKVDTEDKTTAKAKGKVKDKGKVEEDVEEKVEEKVEEADKDKIKNKADENPEPKKLEDVLKSTEQDANVKELKRKAPDDNESNTKRIKGPTCLLPAKYDLFFMNGDHSGEKLSIINRWINANNTLSNIEKKRVPHDMRCECELKYHSQLLNFGYLRVYENTRYHSEVQGHVCNHCKTAPRPIDGDVKKVGAPPDQNNTGNDKQERPQPRCRREAERIELPLTINAGRTRVENRTLRVLQNADKRFTNKRGCNVVCQCDLGYHMELFSSSFKTYKTLDWDGTSNKFVCSICGSSPQPRQYKKK